MVALMPLAASVFRRVLTEHVMKGKVLRLIGTAASVVPRSNAPPPFRPHFESESGEG